MCKYLALKGAPNSSSNMNLAFKGAPNSDFNVDVPHFQKKPPTETVVRKHYAFKGVQTANLLILYYC